MAIPETKMSLTLKQWYDEHNTNALRGTHIVKPRRTGSTSRNKVMDGKGPREFSLEVFIQIDRVSPLLFPAPNIGC